MLSFFQWIRNSVVDASHLKNLPNKKQASENLVKITIEIADARLQIKFQMDSPKTTRIPRSSIVHRQD